MNVILVAFSWVIMMGFIALMLASYWRLYVKAGREGWEGIIPIYNIIVMIQLVNKPIWWVVLLFIPFVNVIIGIWLINLFVKSFGKDELYTLGVLFASVIFIPLLAFGDATWQGEELPYDDEDQDVLDSDLV